MHIAIIGNGISGITAARFIRKLSDHQVTVISSEADHFFSRTALMYVYMGHMRFEDIKPYEDWFWEKNRIDILRAHVDQIDPKEKRLMLSDGQSLSFDRLIIATGSNYNKFGWPGQDLKKVHGLYHLQDLEAMERHSEGLNRAVIVGGGLIGIEMAEMFHTRDIPVTMLVRESEYWNNVLPLQEATMVGRHIHEHHIDLQLSTELAEIHDNGQGEACGITTSDGERIECGYVGLTAGVRPNIELLKDSDIDSNRGILVNEYLRTNQKDIYAIGDCAEQRTPKPGRRPIEAVWYTGRMMGETVAHTVCDDPVAYDPGIWFNSAKFFDIEYQVYGDIPNQPKEEIESLYWEHPDGKKSVRLNFDRNTKRLTGVNLMGIRYRHEVCEKWLREHTSITEVLENLGMANFDPEFYNTYEDQVVAAYNQKYNTDIRLRRKRSLRNALTFLGKIRRTR